jgi:hypothetical protein
MMKIAFVFAAAAAAAVVMLTTAPLGTPAKAQELKMAQGVDAQIGRDRPTATIRPEGSSLLRVPVAIDLSEFHLHLSN